MFKSIRHSKLISNSSKLKLLTGALAILVLIGTPSVFAYQHFNQPEPLKKFNKAFTQPGYTLIAPNNSTNIYLVNNSGKTVHTWTTGHMAGLDTKLLPNGQLLRTYDTKNTAFDMGGQGGGIQILNWNGSIAWDYQYSSDQHLLHHDAMMMPNGHILTSAWVKVSTADALAAGVDPSHIDSEFGGTWSNDIIEIDPATSRIVWQWNAFDHLVQGYDAAAPNYGLSSDYPRRIDANYYKYVTMPDWLHVNAVDYNAATDQVMISAREFNEVWVVDHSTTTAEAATSQGGRYGHGGDLLYRYGNPEAYGHGAEINRAFYLQHDTHWIQDDKLQGNGDVLVFNNGQEQTNQDYSSVLELALPENSDGSYQLDSDGSFMPATLVWQYAPTGQNKFFSKYMGSADRLPNGNTLVCDAMGGRAIEVTPEGRTVWVYKNYYTSDPSAQSPTALFRAYKYSPVNPAVAKLR
ncbi:MAG: aryl-sulfate sulfotransferase [Candidatus Saccharimonadales bacterium]